jgi:hypothetical protein
MVQLDVVPERAKLSEVPTLDVLGAQGAQGFWTRVVVEGAGGVPTR